MTDTRNHRPTSEYEEPPSGVSKGFITFAGIMMIMAGGFQAFAGLVALFENEFYVATRNYLVKFDATNWGWVHLLLGLMVLFAGLAVMSGQTWGRVVGITLAVLSALSNFAFIPYYLFCRSRSSPSTSSSSGPSPPTAETSPGDPLPVSSNR